MDDPFATLGIPRAFACDVAALEKRHRELSRALHPDRYVGAAPSERRAALTRAVEVNEAWRVVRDPIRRAEALLRLAGLAVGETHEPRATPAFLMDVMEQREALAEARAARDLGAVAALAAAMAERAQAAEEALAAGLTADSAPPDTRLPLLVKLGELRFYRRFLDEVSAIEDDLSPA